MRRPGSLHAAALAAAFLLCGHPASAHNDAQDHNSRGALGVTVRAQQVQESFSSYGEVGPIAVSAVSAIEAGVVEQLVLPGEDVKRGQVLAVLGGVQAQSLLARDRSALRAAAIALAADRFKQKAHLVTRQRVAMAETAYEAARGRLMVARATLTLRAPARGEVLTVDVADGERVFAGQRILSLQTGQLWLRATYYGKDALAIHPGMTGRFKPVSGAPIAVRVRTVATSLAPDGGEVVVLVPVSPPGQTPASQGSWRSGLWGKVKLDGPMRRMVAVPSQALILDRARWWVMVLTPKGERRQAVLPGPAHGWMTLIAQGLTPGTRVLVQNAYLAFHQDIAQRYTPPD